jgi:hypothetical protein
MAYVEEVLPEEPIQNPLEHLLFIVPNNWDPPTYFLGESNQRAIETQHSDKNDGQAMEFPICYVEEEIPSEVDVAATSAEGEFSMKVDH